MDMNGSGKRHYPRYFFENGGITFWATLGIIALFIALFVMYNRVSNDLAPDSLLGYSYATMGTIFMLLATLGYTLARRSQKRVVGQLNRKLHWHIAFGIIALVVLILHSFGNFNPRSGTYALFGMIALVVSGIIGRMLDRTLPRKIAQEADRALTEQGDDRAAAITQNIQQLASYNMQQLSSRRPRTGSSQYAQAAKAGKARGDSILPTSWDLAYISLEETPQELQSEGPQTQYRFVPDRRSALSEPGALMPGLSDHLGELRAVQKTLQREQFYRAIIRYWRVLHVCLVLLTFALTLWHLEFAATLLIPTLGR